jgi:hypothetical protein
MRDIDRPCHGQVDGMVPCSEHLEFTRPYKLWWRARLAVSHFFWHCREKGLWGVMQFSFSKFMKLLGFGSGHPVGDGTSAKQPREDEVLNLQPGEWVEVKSEQEILAILDANGAYKGLRWMCNMRKFCGKKYRVFKRLETMLLESSGKYRQVKNTVLLEGVTCDGEDWFGCDRSCYHFWREVWLRRVEPSCG